MNQSLTPQKLVHLDNSPVFFTGLATNTPPQFCKLCNVVLTDDIKLTELCLTCVKKSIESISKKQINETTERNSSKTNRKESKEKESVSNIKKTPLLPSPCSSGNPNALQQNNSDEALRAVSSSCANDNISRNSPSTPKQKQPELKWKKGGKTQLETRFQPYINRNKKDENRSSSRPLLHTPSPPAPLPYEEVHESPRTNFRTLNSSTWLSSEKKRSNELSREIWTVFHKNKQTQEVFQGKMRLRDKLHEILLNKFPSCGLYVVGSSMTGLGVTSSDIDMCLMLTHSEIDQSKEALQILYKVRGLFRRYNFLNDIQVIPAKVPILKFFDSVSGIEVDLNINNATGIRNTQLLSSYARMDDRLPPLVVLVKLWARHHDINDAKCNTLSSYSIVLMVIHFLQYRCVPPVLPSLQSLQPDKYQNHTDVRHLKLHEDLPNFVSENREDLGDLFVEFLNYYANEFNYDTDVISVRLGDIIPREEVKHNFSPKNKEAHWKYICIEEPFDLTNTARSVFNEKAFRYIQYTFQNSWKCIKRTYDLYCILE